MARLRRLPGQDRARDPGRGAGAGLSPARPKPAPLLAVDAPSLLFRAFYALPSSIKGKDGKPVNALLGAANLIIQEVLNHDPRAVVLCFGPDAATYRTELFSGYHAERDQIPDELSPQFAACDRFFGAFGWEVRGHDSLEADDLLGTYAMLESGAGGTALLFTGDRDMFQCASEAVKVLYVRTGKRGAELIGPSQVKERYGIGPELVPDFIALRGDPSDGIPGAKGVGEKTAAELLRRDGSLEGVLENAIRETRPKLRTALTEQREELLAFKDVATLRDAGVKRPPDRASDWPGAAAAARDFGMDNLAKRLEEIEA